MIVSLAQQVGIDSILPNKDPLYLTWMWRNILEFWGMMLSHPAETIICMALLCAILLCYKQLRAAWIAGVLRIEYALYWVGTLPGIRHIRKWLGDKAMRKEVRATQSDEWVDEIIEITESKVAAEQWTRTQAKEWYATFSKNFPVLRYAATHDDTDGDLKAVIRERRLNEHRDVNGKIIPVPVP